MYGFEIRYRSCILVLAILEKSDWEIREIGGRKLTTTLCACNQITRRRRRKNMNKWLLNRVAWFSHRVTPASQTGLCFFGMGT